MWRKVVRKVIKKLRKVDNIAFDIASKRGSIPSICRRGTMHCLCKVRF